MKISTFRKDNFQNREVGNQLTGTYETALLGCRIGNFSLTEDSSSITYLYIVPYLYMGTSYT